LKNLIYTLAITILVGCNTSSQKTAGPTGAIAHVATAPQSLSKEEFQYYSNVVKNHFEGSLLNRGFNGQILIAKNGTVVFEKAVGFAGYENEG
jgi:hypothetical protein